MPDYSIGIAERIASLADSTATANSVHQNDFTVTSLSVINKVTVAIAPSAPTTLDPTPQTTYATVTDTDSVTTYGLNEAPLTVTLLADIDQAGALAQYLIRSVPAYWFSNLTVMLNDLSSTDKATVAQLEIGQQIAVIKTFPAGVVPQTVTEYLFVEGIDHEITPDSHKVTIFTGPATTYLQWVLGNYATTVTRQNLVLNPNIELAPSGWNYSASVVAIAQSTTYANTGLYSISETFISNNTADLNPGYVAVTANTTYNFSAYLRSTVSRSARVYISWYNGTTFLSNSVGSLSASSTSGFTRYTVSGTAPATATQCITNMQIVSGITGDVHYWDSLLLETGSSALPYFDGTYAAAYTGYTLTYQAWDGSADASSSTTVWGLNASGTGSPLNDSTYGLA